MGKNRILQHAVHAVLTAAAASAAVPAVYAQTAPAAAAAAPEIQEVVVTGSRIQSANLISASPITTVTNVDIQQSGLTRVEDILNNLPQVFAGQGSNMSNGADGTSTLDLHDLGPQRTLVLVNGKRVAPGAPDGRNYTDINQIPAELIERVEVLTGGASSTYGADAVSGVVNFIMNTHYEGVKIDAQYGMFNHSNHETQFQNLVAGSGFNAPTGSVDSGFQKDVSFIAGSNFADGAGNATVYATYNNQAENIGGQFDYSACSLSHSAAAGVVCGGSGTSAGGTIIAYNSGPGKVFPNQTVDPKTGLLRAATGADNFNFGALNFFQRPAERWTAGSFINYDVNEHVKVYNEFMFMRNETTGGIAPGGDFANNLLGLDCGPVGPGLTGNPLITAQERGILCSDANLAKQGQPPAAQGGILSYYLERRNIEGGLRLTDFTNTDFHEVLGVKGDFLGAWKYDAYAQVGITDQQQLNLNNFSAAKLALAENPVINSAGNIACGPPAPANCVPYNPWVPGGVTAAQLNYLSTPALQQGSAREYVVHADVTGDLGKYGVQAPWAKSGLQVNMGAEYRSESAVLQPDEENLLGDIAGGAGALLPLAGNFHVAEVFTEFNAPIMDEMPFAEQLTVNGGYRYSKYTLGFSTNTYKIGVEWAPIRDVRFRASYNQAVRAPNIAELFTTATIGPGGSIDPCWGGPGLGATPSLTAAQCARTGVTAAQYGTLGVNPASQFNVQTGGNANLHAETAHTWSYGVVFQPTFLPNFSATLDYYDIRITGAIEQQSGVSIITNCGLTGDPTQCGEIHRNPANGSLWLTNAGFVATLSQNSGLVENKGVDINLHYSFNMDTFGKLIFNLQGTDTISNVTQPQTSVPDPVTGALVPGAQYNCAGFEGVTCLNPLPHWRHIFSTDWATPWQGLDLHAQWRFIGATQVDALSQSSLLSSPSTVFPGFDHVPTYSYLDLSASVSVMSNFTVRVGANNVLDKDPPIILSANCPVGPCNNNTWTQTYDPTGRFLYVHLEGKF
ncbi:MAG TPA: TonB-dependent receptor [Steroidobacteraceae bacterium]|jgi:outer membrane receptor protein involved in Fe transport|nr:TonB-dependent receptor [Steroidobacteraceae bacterium]